MGGQPESNAPRVLVVEDEAAVRGSIVRALDRAGHVARGLPDGGSLEETLEPQGPRIVHTSRGLGYTLRASEASEASEAGRAGAAR